MSTRVKTALSYGASVAILYIVFAFLFTSTENSSRVWEIIITGIITGAVSGLAFPWLMGKLAGSRLVNESTQIDIIPSEKIILQSPANHLKGIEAVGGKLYLTDKRLVFKSHKLNLQNHLLSIDLSDITGFRAYKVLGIVNKGLWVTHRLNTEKFVVEKLQDWIDHLNQAERISIKLT